MEIYTTTLEKEATLPLIQRKPVQVEYSQSVQTILSQKSLTWKKELCQESFVKLHGDLENCLLNKLSLLQESMALVNIN